jgi:glycosyltransferase involved in cell wall biosynthesis
MFGDQHVESSGGAQVSMRLQRRFLERAGHTVTIVAPRLHARGSSSAVGGADAAYVDLPSVPITPDREYSLSWPGRRTDRFVDAAMAERPPVDVVHVQADFWGALIGHRFAARHGLPVVHTMHNRVDVGIRATAPFPSLVLRALNAWAQRVLTPAHRRGIAPTSEDSGETLRRTQHSPTVGGRGGDGWAYLRRFGMLSHAVTAPSAHFAGRLQRHGVLPGMAGAEAPVDVIWNGIDDDVLDAALAAGRPERAPGRPRFVWVGRMSPEKRLLPFLEAVARSGVDAHVVVIGGGGQLRAAERIVRRFAIGTDQVNGSPPASVVFAGRLPYAETLARIAAADAVVQTSIGFETQGMTVFEAASLGTPSVVNDPDIARELGTGHWPVTGDSIGELGQALTRAARDVAAGSAPVPDPRIAEEFRQSSRTAAMIAVYERAIALSSRV